MGGHVKVHQATAIMVDHDNDEQNLEECCRKREEIDRNELFGVILQKCPPRLGWRLRMPDHVLAY
jgi:hypothetical protein